ncbi:hypothetical protein HDU67_010219 [Dinochytrium kinnereticum]|nr:hypothetical protein HDU67_010219 [Dinochytrium kinnereticum]
MFIGESTTITDPADLMEVILYLDELATLYKRESWEAHQIVHELDQRLRISVEEIRTIQTHYKAEIDVCALDSENLRQQLKVAREELETLRRASPSFQESLPSPSQRSSSSTDFSAGDETLVLNEVENTRGVFSSPDLHLSEPMLSATLNSMAVVCPPALADFNSDTVARAWAKRIFGNIMVKKLRR